MNVFYFILFFVIRSLCLENNERIQESKITLVGTKITFFGKTVTQYLGITYAYPPKSTYRLRFTGETNESSFKEGARFATPAGPCFQTKLPKGFSSHEEMETTPEPSEECLNFNMWVPDGKKKMPVLVFFHGDSFTFGSASQDRLNGSVLSALTDAIVIVPNSRLGFLGFAYFKSGVISGNMGLMDQQLLLKWIHKTIKLFDGDNQKVTLFGTGSGSTSVAAHLLSEESKSYFKNAITDLGLTYNKMELMSTETADKNTREVCKLVGCISDNNQQETDEKILECLQNKTIEQLIEAVEKFTNDGDYPTLFPFMPTNNDTIFFKKKVELKKEIKTTGKDVASDNEKKIDNLFLLIAKGLVDDKTIGCLLYPETNSENTLKACDVTKEDFNNLNNRGGKLLKLNATETKQLKSIYNNSGSTYAEKLRNLLLDLSQNCGLSKLNFDFSTILQKSVFITDTITIPKTAENLENIKGLSKDPLNYIFGTPFRRPENYNKDILEKVKNYSKNIMWAIGNFTTNDDLPPTLKIDSSEPSQESSKKLKRSSPSITEEKKSSTCEQLEELLNQSLSWRKKQIVSSKAKKQ